MDGRVIWEMGWIEKWNKLLEINSKKYVKWANEDKIGERGEWDNGGKGRKE